MLHSVGRLKQWSLGSSLSEPKKCKWAKVRWWIHSLPFQGNSPKQSKTPPNPSQTKSSYIRFPKYRSPLIVTYCDTTNAKQETKFSVITLEQRTLGLDSFPRGNISCLRCTDVHNHTNNEHGGPPHTNPKGSLRNTERFGKDPGSFLKFPFNLGKVSTCPLRADFPKEVGNITLYKNS